MRESRKLEQAGAAPLRDDRDAVTPVGGLKDAAVHGSPRAVQLRARLGAIGATGPDGADGASAAARRSRTGLPDALKAGIEQLSGMSMDAVRVHYNSAQPAQLNAHAYAQGHDIHLGPGQERHLPHEAWHIVQQAQGRVRATMQTHGGVPVNNDGVLEREADAMGQRALSHMYAQRHGPMVQLAARPEAGLPVQCVGGPKFGLQPLGNADDAIVKAGIATLKHVLDAYKAEVRGAKHLAATEFNAGDKADEGRQTAYTQALRNAEITPQGLRGRLPGDFTMQGNLIVFQGRQVAQLLHGQAAYAQTAPALSAQHSAIYKRHTLDGPAGKDYVMLGGNAVRRFAYRGITPPEREQYKAGQALTPLNRGAETEGKTGFKFKSHGEAKPRKHDPANNKQTDLEWLNAHARTAQGTVRNDPHLLAFLQTRKGVNKAFSATSTPKHITSNHGAGFTEYGNIRIDLAQVPAANVMHHYNAQGFTPASVAHAMGVPAGHNHSLAWETARANDSIARNRELVLSSIPNAAVAELQDVPERTAYEARFRALFGPAFHASFLEQLGDEELPAVAAPAVPQALPFKERHYTSDQADRDKWWIDARAREHATAAVAEVRAYCDGYIAQYQAAWSEAYLNTAYDLVTSDDWQAENGAPGFGHTVPEPVPPVLTYRDIMAPGSGRAAGEAAGRQAGEAAGTQAGGGYAVPKQTAAASGKKKKGR
ncbi:hypothetical protein LMG19282_02577 [Cupriavidus campinensis]|uniref:DUF4157 domain-containing protein n=1 Tax=Cupriavidus campinensis TaxID=151783 RepID=A0ABY3EU03_9BURK|nr:DUF4157 domain-containing protein [Cupriavidus campinensis]TSP14261.1 DUF4157 domain-containing protein [Cupriavidus campinensis]CAG2144410.1 hypothetical protein LMG19282_02577 [Cupriavidus campinensis]